MTDDEIEKVLKECIADGSVTNAGVNSDGEPLYAITEEGSREVQDLLRANGIDPDDRDAVLAFLRAMCKEEEA